MQSSRSIHALLVVVLLLACWGLAQDFKNTEKGGAIDLRNRVTGARVLAKHGDPYFYKWKIEDGDLLCDPFNAASVPVSKTTVTPLSLALHVPFADWNYRTLQWCWFVVQYACLAGGFGLWAWGQARANATWGGIFTLAVCACSFWRLHVDRGQTYVLYAALLLGLSWVGRRKGRGWDWLEGAGAVLLCGLRPVYLGLPGVPLVQRRWDALTGMIVGAGLALLVPSFIGDTTVWSRYQKGMQVHSSLYMTHAQPARSPMEFSPEVEGIPLDTLAGFAAVPFADTSIYRLVSFSLPPGWMLGGWAVLALVACLRLARNSAGSAVVWWAVSAWAVAGDFLLPAFRNPYNDILVWPVLLLGLEALQGGGRRLWIGLAGALLAAQAVVWIMPPWFIPVPSVMGLLLSLGVVAWTTFLSWQKGCQAS